MKNSRLLSSFVFLAAISVGSTQLRADSAVVSETEPLAAAAADQASGETAIVARTYQFKHKHADRAAVLIKSLVSAGGSMSIQPATNTLVVTDRAENIKNITAALQQFDAPPKSFVIDIRLVSAGRAGSAAPVPADLKDIAARLSGVLRFNSFEKLGEITVEGKEGDPTFGEVKSRYRAEFKLGDYDPLSNTIRLTDLRVLRAEAPKDGVAQLVSILKTSLNLKVGQMFILTAARQPQSDRALMIIVTARRPG